MWKGSGESFWEVGLEEEGERDCDGIATNIVITEVKLLLFFIHKKCSF